MFLVFLGGDGRRIPAKMVAEAVTDAAAGRTEVIVSSACWFVAYDGADRVRSVVVASAPLIFPISQRTCICIVLSFDSSSEYLFARIAEGILTKVAGLGLHATKKMAACFA
jgi:hypothetical protein